MAGSWHGSKAAGWQRWRRIARYWVWRLARQTEAKEAIARGIGVGIFAGFLPMLGQSFVAIALAMLVRGSKVVAAGMTFVSNPATTLPIFAFNYYVGAKTLGREMMTISMETFSSWEAFSQLGGEFVAVIGFGSCVVGGVVGGISYGTAHWLITREQMRKKAVREQVRSEASLRRSSAKPGEAVAS